MLKWTTLKGKVYQVSGTMPFNLYLLCIVQWSLPGLYCQTFCRFPQFNHISIQLSIYLSIYFSFHHPSIHLSILPFWYIFIHIFIYSFMNLWIYSSIHLFIYESMNLSLYLFGHLYVFKRKLLIELLKSVIGGWSFAKLNLPKLLF